MMKKVLCLILAVMLIFTFIACDNKSEDNSNTEETPEAPVTPETPETPEVPENPENPENPETPENPENPDNGDGEGDADEGSGGLDRNEDGSVNLPGVIL